MQTEEREKLRLLIANATQELTASAQQHSQLLQQLESLNHSLDTGTPTDDALRSSLQAFPARAQPMRAGAPATDGLKATRQLWQELNRIVKSRQEGRP
jgi:ribosomal 50S subunit-associated protein YjgA (DUF615 family)